mmetsp:Transcript_84500/g.244278  ORF Transcript_84500/g.244278 Transcript_84500/m.244278 type:complete len:210 (+) Transcript_84500:656-1285(+)
MIEKMAQFVITTKMPMKSLDKGIEAKRPSMGDMSAFMTLNKLNTAPNMSGNAAWVSGDGTRSPHTSPLGPATLTPTKAQMYSTMLVSNMTQAMPCIAFAIPITNLYKGGMFLISRARRRIRSNRAIRNMLIACATVSPVLLSLRGVPMNVKMNPYIGIIHWSTIAPMTIMKSNQFHTMSVGLVKKLRHPLLFNRTTSSKVNMIRRTCSK